MTAKVSLKSQTGRRSWPPQGPPFQLVSCKLPVCLQRVVGAHHRGAGAHVDRHTERFGYFLLRGTLLESGFDVKPDAVIALTATDTARAMSSFVLRSRAFVARADWAMLAKAFITSGAPLRKLRS